MELIIHFRSDNLDETTGNVDIRVDMSVKDMSVIDILAALGLVIIEVEKQFDTEIDTGLIVEVIRKIKDERS